MVEFVKRLTKGAVLTFEEMDGNFVRIEDELRKRPTLSDTSMSVINAVLNLRDNVDSNGDTLAKLYNLILELEQSKINKANISNSFSDDSLTNVMSANQGRLLSNGLNSSINNVSQAIETTTTNLLNRMNTLTDDLSSIINQEILDRNEAIALLSSQSSNIYVTSKTNTETQTLSFGQPVYNKDNLNIALSAANDVVKKNVIGLVADNTISSFGSGFIQTSGILEGTVAQWELVTNSMTGLIPGKYYFLDNTSGKLTHTPPNTFGSYVCCIGQSISANVLSININRPITL